MDLPNLFNAPPADRMFLGVLVLVDQVQAALWQVSHDQLIILKLSQPHEYQDETSAVVAVDLSLQDLGEESEGINEVVFGFDPSWVGETGIKDERKPLLKHLTKELTLKAVGFVVVTEATLQHLRHVEGTLTSLVVQILAQQVVVTWVQRGVVKGEATVGRSAQLAADVVEGLAHLTKQATAHVWPPHLDVIGHGVLETVLHEGEQQLHRFDWVGQQDFQHPPSVQVHAPDTSLKAIVLEGGRAVAEAQGLLKTVPGSEAAVVEPMLGSERAAILPDMSEHANLVPTNELGFQPLSSQLDLTETAVSPEIINPHQPIKTNSHQPVMSSHPAFVTHTHPDTDTQPAEPPRPRKRGWAQYKPFVMIGVGLGLVALILVAAGGVWWTMQAEVAIKLKTKAVSQDVKVTLDSAATQSNPDQLILAAKVVKQSAEGTKAIPTTGVKLVGDKAKGVVVLANKTDSVKKFAAGTKLSTGKYLFTLDKEVTVASASVSQQGSSGETRTYGKAEGSVVADAIGTESNLSKDAELKIDDFSNTTYTALVKDGLGGGASREVRVVAEKDRQTVMEKLKGELQTKVATDLKGQAGQDEYVVPTGKNIIDKQTYDSKVGDEVEAISLSLQLTGEGLSYRIADLRPLAVAVLQNQVPSGYELIGEPPQLLTSPENLASGSAKVQVAANLSSKAKPKVDTEAWKAEIKGLPVDQAEATLKKHAEIEHVTVTFNPSWLAKIWARLPSRVATITIQTE